MNNLLKMNYLNFGISSDEEITRVVGKPKQKKKFKQRINYSSDLNEKEFIDRFRLSKKTVKHLISKIRHKIESPTLR